MVIPFRDDRPLVALLGGWPSTTPTREEDQYGMVLHNTQTQITNRYEYVGKKHGGGGGGLLPRRGLDSLLGFDAFEILNRIESEREALNAVNVKQSNQGFAERKSK